MGVPKVGNGGGGDAPGSRAEHARRGSSSKRKKKSSREQFSAEIKWRSGVPSSSGFLLVEKGAKRTKDKINAHAYMISFNN